MYTDCPHFTSGIKCKKQVPKKTPPPKQLASFVNLCAFFNFDALMGARPMRNGSKNMATIPPHFAPIEDLDSTVTSDRNSSEKFHSI